MAIMRADEIREKNTDELKQKLNEFERELIEERGQIEVGGFADNPGRIGEVKKTIARIKTILNERGE